MTIALTRAQVREVDRRAIEEFGIPGIVLMENAGRGAAEVIRARLPAGGRAAVVCGRGNNGGDGFVIARHLALGGFAVQVFVACDPSILTGDAATNCEIARRMGIPMVRVDSPGAIAASLEALRSAAVVVDAVLGTGFFGDVRSPLDDIIAAINTVGRHVVAIDVPSGLDCDSGLPGNATVRATETVTFVARKIGFDVPGAAAYTGEVHVVGIGAPDDTTPKLSS